MTLEDFSLEFDLLFNNISSNKAPGLEPYEKSVFLTQAQDKKTIDLYTGRNATRDSFEQTEELRRYLGELVKTAELTTHITDSTNAISEDSVFFELPTDLLFITFEEVTLKDDKLGCANNSVVKVVPITQDEFHRISQNPFKQASKRKALRLDIKGNKVELVSKYHISKYTVRYIAKPDPIILEDLPEGLSINGKTKAMNCSLNESIHRDILETAVALAIQATQ